MGTEKVDLSDIRDSEGNEAKVKITPTTPRDHFSIFCPQKWGEMLVFVNIGDNQKLRLNPLKTYFSVTHFLHISAI